MMTILRHSPPCDSELPADPPDGVCPKCPAQPGLEGHADTAGDEPATTGATPDRESVRPPSPLEIDAALERSAIGATRQPKRPQPPKRSCDAAAATDRKSPPVEAPRPAPPEVQPPSPAPAEANAGWLRVPLFHLTAATATTITAAATAIRAPRRPLRAAA